jgi:hypothetical protein
VNIREQTLYESEAYCSVLSFFSFLNSETQIKEM